MWGPATVSTDGTASMSSQGDGQTTGGSPADSETWSLLSALPGSCRPAPGALCTSDRGRALRFSPGITRRSGVPADDSVGSQPTGVARGQESSRNVFIM